MLCVLEPGNEEALRGLVSVFLFGLLIWASNFYGRPHLQLENLATMEISFGICSIASPLYLIFTRGIIP